MPPRNKEYSSDNTSASDDLQTSSGRCETQMPGPTRVGLQKQMAPRMP